MKILINETEAIAAQKLREMIATIDPDVEILQFNSQVDKLLSTLRTTQTVQRYLVRSGTRLISVAIQDIAFFYIRDRMACIRTHQNTDHFIDKSLDDIANELDPHDFFRLNRQCIVHYRSIVKVQSWFNGKLKVQVKPALEEDVIVSRLRAPDFRKWLGE